MSMTGLTHNLIEAPYKAARGGCYDGSAVSSLQDHWVLAVFAIPNPGIRHFSSSQAAFLRFQPPLHGGNDPHRCLGDSLGFAGVACPVLCRALQGGCAFLIAEQSACPTLRVF